MSWAEYAVLIVVALINIVKLFSGVDIVKISSVPEFSPNVALKSIRIFCLGLLLSSCTSLHR